MVWGIAGCAFPQKQRVNPVYADAQTTIEFLIDAVDRKDAQAIKDMFSPYAKDNIDHFDEKIDRFIEEFPGWTGDYELSDTFERWSDHGKITYMMTPSFDYVVDDKGYCLRMIYYTEADEDETRLGWYSLQIFEYPNPDYSDGFYMHGTKDEPDILLWDYLKDGTD
ncbi:MAG: DUF5104 domain-containing protein [Bacteroides sp.]|nr:DUF5104 domain-containing protein [Bacteroides sp.]